MKKETGTKNIYFAVIVLAAVLFSGCFISGTTGELVSPTIRAIGLPDADIIDSVTLRVTGPDMEPVEVSYSQLPSVINIAIPEGQNRTFELTVNTGSSYIGPVKSYKGTATASIDADNAVVTLNMGIGSTKLIVPDPEWFSGAGPEPRILQFDDINDTSSEFLNLIALNSQLAANELPSLSDFIPYDIDFDNEGRIYIANNSWTDSYIIRIDDILGTGATLIPPAGAGNSIRGIAVDRNMGVVYYIVDYGEGVDINYCDLDGGSDQFLDSFGGNLSGLAVNDGYLYISDENNQVLKYDISKKSVINSFNSNLNSPWDVMVKDNYVYVANMNGADGWKIIRLESDLTNPIGYGLNSTSGWEIPDTSKEYFYNPRRFVAVLNKKITIIDDSETNGNLDKLVSIDDISGTNWSTLPTGNNDGTSLFAFYHYSSC